MSGALLNRIRQPEYTGDNRCMPCTAVNLVIAVAITLVVGWAFIPAGVVFFVIALGAIALRGYLVPGTPELTARYLPDRIHRYFEHGPDQSAGDEEAIERTLLEWDVLEVCANEDDLCLREPIRERFHEHLDTIRDSEIDEALVAPLVAPDSPRIRIARKKPPLVRIGGGRSTWPSKAALKADVAMAETLEGYVPEWEDTPLDRRGPLLAGLRAFLDDCPGCGGAIALDEEVVRSCCRERDVIQLHCTECEATIFEVDASAVGSD